MALTLDQFREIDDDDGSGFRYELDGGELVATVIPGRRHGRWLAKVGGSASQHVESLHLGEVVAGCGFLLCADPATLRAPDVAFVRAGRLGDVADEDWFEFAPDLAVEIVSPSDRLRDVERKARQYLDAGTDTVWVMLPDTRRTYVHRRGVAVECVEGHEALTAPGLLPGFAIRLNDIA